MKIGTLSKSLALATPLVALAPTDLDAAAYIKFDGIIGESSDTGFEGFLKLGDYKIDIANFQAGESVSDASIGFAMEKASPRLMLACATGVTIPNATIILTRTDDSGIESSYLKIVFTDVKVSTYKNERKSTSDTPTDAITMNYEEIKITYTARDSSGNPIETVTTGTLTR